MDRMGRKTLSERPAFTLIELLAVPNFLEAQVRAKVSRAKNDMRAIAGARPIFQTPPSDTTGSATPSVHAGNGRTVGPG